MIDPRDITNYGRNDFELEELILFCLCVAGKSAMVVSRNLENFLIESHFIVGLNKYEPFNVLRKFEEKRIASMLKFHGIGCFNIKGKGIYELVHSGINLRTCGVDDLERIHGIGPKTARFFILHSRRDVRIAVLDRHILKYMSAQGISVPETTPTGNKYKDLEVKFLELADKSGMTTAQFDLYLWRKYSGN